ncbi:MAG: GyrI-like domain-containing protein [Verrucomicrobiales bacterium]|nr:GyrI-like domain-containing protein [Verrucomicrobiae bacterium]MCP5553288.1 GyrI-like domain-containing protein [Akkermansiaceae bacterium]
MLDPPILLQTEACLAAVIPVVTPRDQVGSVMGPAIAEVLEAVASQGIGPVGPVFAHHSRITPEVFDFEVGVPVSGPLLPVGRVRAGELPGALVLRTIYTGPYEELHDAWREFKDWVGRNGYEVSSHPWETFLSDSGKDLDPSTYRTELNFPLL